MRNGKEHFVTRLCGDEIQEGERWKLGGRKKRMKYSENMDERKQNGVKENIRSGQMEATTVVEIFLITGFSVIKCISLLLPTLGWQPTAEVVYDYLDRNSCSMTFISIASRTEATRQWLGGRLQRASERIPPRNPMQIRSGPAVDEVITSRRVKISRNRRLPTRR